MTRVIITAMLAWVAVGVWAVPARAAVDIHIGIPGVITASLPGWLATARCLPASIQPWVTHEPFSRGADWRSLLDAAARR